MRVQGLPFGLGTHAQWDRKLDGRLAQAVMAVQAIKGVEIGLGFEAARRRGSQVHDPIHYDAARKHTPTLGYVRPTNNAGGLEAGMTNGQPLVIRAAKKPISTLRKPLESINLDTKEPEAASYERSDVCAISAASVIVENVVAFEIAAAVVDKVRRRQPRGNAGAVQAVYGDGGRAVSAPARRGRVARKKLWQKRTRMFRLHETTRRRVCRLAFVVLCAAPTVSVVLWVLYAHRPGRLAAEQARIESDVHLAVRLADWQHPRPGAVRSAAIELVDPASGDVLVKLVEFERHRAAGGIVCAAQLIDLALDRRELLVTRADEWLLELADERSQLHAPAITATAGARRLELRNTQLRVERRDDGTIYGQLIVNIPGMAVGAAPLRITIEFRPGPDKRLLLSVDTNQTAVPAWLIGSIAPALSCPDDRATFSGELQIECLSDQIHGVAQGQWKHLALDHLLSPGSPHAIHGRATVTASVLLWQDDAIERVVGSVKAESCAASPSLIAAAVKHLLCGQASAGRPR